MPNTSLNPNQSKKQSIAELLMLRPTEELENKRIEYLRRGYKPEQTFEKMQQIRRQEKGIPDISPAA